MMEEYSKEIELLIETIRTIKLKNSFYIMMLNKEISPLRKDMRAVASLEVIKILNDGIARI
jgi:hypothetical protein